MEAILQFFFQICEGLFVENLIHTPVQFHGGSILPNDQVPSYAFGKRSWILDLSSSVFICLIPYRGVIWFSDR